MSPATPAPSKQGIETLMKVLLVIALVATLLGLLVGWVDPAPYVAP